MHTSTRVRPGSTQPGWHWQLLPNDLIYKSYLAGVKEARSGTMLTHIQSDGWLWEGVLGTRVGLLRYGDHDPVLPQGFQIDAEGAANVRLDVEDDVNVRSTDYRVGVPFTYGFGSHQTKLAYYHLSSHLGDEFVLGNPDFDRLNWSRDAFVLGHSIYLTETLRMYAEAGWAFHYRGLRTVGIPVWTRLGSQYSHRLPWRTVLRHQRTSAAGSGLRR